MKAKALFPALKTFRIFVAPNLIEWIEPPVMKEEQISMFPRLEELDLVECPHHFASLRKLEMNICHELSDLTSLVEKCTSLQNLEISSCDKLRSLSLFGLTSIRKLLFSSHGGGLTSTNLHRGSELYTRVSLDELSIKCPSLEKLEISRCISLISISIHGATSLGGLKISSCGELRSMDLQSLPECYTPLEVLSLRSCRSVESISGLHGCTSLRELTVEDCDGLRGLESCTSICALRVHDYQQLGQYSAYGVDMSLIEELTIYNCPKLICISNHSLTTLRKLVLIASCESELSIGSSTTLKELYLQDCTSLGSVDGLETLTILEELTIRNCPSLTFIPIIPCLRGLVIEGCENLSSLPSELKHCNALERLKITGSRNLQSIVFPPYLGQFVIADCAQLSSLSGDHGSLEELSIVNCPELRWSSVAKGGKSLTALRKLVIASSGGPELNIMSISSLEEISLHDCTSLRELRIWDCRNLRHSVRDGWGIQPPLSLEVLFIHNCPNLVALPSLDNLTSLRILDIRSINTLEEISLHDCTSLDTLEIVYCHNLISVADVDVTSLQSLSRLIIRGCKKLQYLPTGLHTLTSLVMLKIGGLWEELDSFPVSQIPSSKILEFHGWPKLRSLPQVINHSTSPVEYLSINNCDGLETLPEWLGDLTSLDRLDICNCKNLRSMPSAQAMQRLPKLQYLEISGCSILTERCARGTGPEWPKISRIPSLYLDSRWV